MKFFSYRAYHSQVFLHPGEDLWIHGGPYEKNHASHPGEISSHGLSNLWHYTKHSYIDLANHMVPMVQNLLL